MNVNTIYKYDMANIYKNGILNKKDKTILFNSKYRNDYKVIDNYNDCLLFDQIRKELNNVDLKEVLVLMDFNNFKQDIMKLQNYENGIILNIDGKLITFEIFIKSNSMSRSYECYYINKEYKDRISKRLTFGFDKNRLAISKWSAYLGLTCSSAVILDDIHLNSEEVCIVKDRKEDIKCDCITVISIRYIYSLLEKYLNNLSNEKYSNNIKDELNHYILSKDFVNIDEILKEFINEFLNLFELDINVALKEGKQLKDKYGKYKDKDVKWQKLEVHNFNVNVNYYDGVGLIDFSLGEQIYQSLENKNGQEFENDHYSFQIRLPFLKGMVHSCDLYNFFQEHHINKIKSIINFKNDGYEYEYKDVSKIKMIISESQFKASKYLKQLNNLQGYKNQIDYYFGLINKYDYPLAIANIETKEDKRGRLNYQFLTTLPLNDNDIDHMIEISKEEIRKKSDIKSIQQNLKDNHKDVDYLMSTRFRDYYLNTERFKTLRNEIIQHEKNEVIIGKIKCNSSRRYLTPDLLGFLYYVIDKPLPNHEILEENQFYAPLTNRELSNRFKNNKYDDTYGIILRNPHYSRNEIVVSKRSHIIESERENYFNHLYGVLMVNSRSLYANRLGGADYDGDSVLFVDDAYYVKNMYDRLMINNNFIYKFANIPSLEEDSNTINYQMMIKSLNLTFSNKTGLISNIAFVKALEGKDNPDIYDDLAYYTILSGLEIDSVKSGCKPIIDEDTRKENLFIDVKNAIKKHDVNDSNYITNKKTINNIHKKKDECYLYKIMSEIIKYEPKNLNVLKLKNYKELLNINNDFDIKNRISVISTIAGFNKLVSLNKVCAINSKQAFTNIDVIVDFVKDKVKDYDFKQFLEYFRSDNPKSLLSIYHKNNYHFLVDYNDKVNFISNDLGLSLPNDILKIVTDFKDHGYLLLYYCLVYWKEISIIEFKIDFNSISSSKEIEKLNGNDKKYAYNIRNKMIEDIINIKPLGEWKYDELLSVCNQYIKNNYPLITFNDVGNAIDLLKDTIQYELFSDQMLAYYESEGEVCEEY